MCFLQKQNMHANTLTARSIVRYTYYLLFLLLVTDNWCVGNVVFYKQVIKCVEIDFKISWNIYFYTNWSNNNSNNN